MAGRKMHPGELEVHLPLVRGLLASQFPEWADLGVEPVDSDGTDNAIFRLGPDMAVRLPRYAAPAQQAVKEACWLPRLAPFLPLAVPVPAATGAPGDGYPFHWSVCRWLPGTTATPDRITDESAAAIGLAEFVAALRRIDAAEGPPPGDHNFCRGVPLALRDGYVRAALASLHGTIDTDAAAAAWETALAAAPWEGSPVWLHGDLHTGNLLAVEGRLSGVVDWGGLGAGDPACDVMAAWTFLPAGARATFRDALAIDDATWERGRGWALSVGLIALPYYRETNPPLARSAQRWIEEALRGD